MHEQEKVENELKLEATVISKNFDSAPVVIIIGGDTETNTPLTMTTSSIKG